MKNKKMCTLEELNLQAAMLKGKGDLEGVIRLAEANGLTVRTAERYLMGEEERIKLQISDTIEYTEHRLEEAEKERVNRTYSGFLESIKQRPRSKARWWRRTR